MSGDWRISLLAALLTGLLRLLASTWRVRVVNGQAHDSLRASGQPFIYALWHGQLLPLIWHHRGTGTALLISQSRDGELIARVGTRLGMRALRGSTSKGASRALLELARLLEERQVVAVTTDGPRGPARVFAPGALIAAQRAGVPVLCVAAGARSAWRLRSWDSFLIPKPFARVTVAYAEPTLVGGHSARDAAAETSRFARLLDETSARANGRS